LRDEADDQPRVVYVQLLISIDNEIDASGWLGCVRKNPPRSDALARIEYGHELRTRERLRGPNMHGKMDRDRQLDERQTYPILADSGVYEHDVPVSDAILALHVIVTHRGKCPYGQDNRRIIFVQVQYSVHTPKHMSIWMHL